MFSGFRRDTLCSDFGPLFQQLGITAVQGGAAAQRCVHAPSRRPDWEHSLQPGETVAGVLVAGDMSVTGPRHGHL